MMRKNTDGKKQGQELLSYVFFGGLTTLVNFLSYMLFEALLGQERYLYANAIAWILSVLFAYITNKLFVFGSKSFAPGVLGKEISGFVAARIFSFFVEELGLWLLVDVISLKGITLWNVTVTGQLIAKVLLAVVVIIMNYFFSKCFIFSPKGK